jgi:hypothetical protein
MVEARAISHQPSTNNWRCKMLKTVEALIDPHGNVRLLEPVALPTVQRAIVTILADIPFGNVPETALLSEAALAEDWNRPEEDAAWAHLQPVQSS